MRYKTRVVMPTRLAMFALASGAPPARAGAWFAATGLGQSPALAPFRWLLTDTPVRDWFVAAVAVTTLVTSIALTAVLAWQLSRRKKTEAVLRRHTQRLTAILDAQAQLAACTQDYDALMQILVDQADDLIERADGAAIEFPEGDQIVTRFASARMGRHVGHRMPLEHSFSGACLRSGAALCTGQALSDSRVNHALAIGMNVQSLLAIPLRYRGENLGVFKLVSKRMDAFSSADQKDAQLIGGMLANIISLAAEMRHKSVLLAERSAALEHLRKSEQRFADFMAFSPCIAFIKDHNGRYQYLNNAAHRLIPGGQDAIGRADDELFPPAIAEELKRHDQTALAGEAAPRYTRMIAGADTDATCWLFIKFGLAGPNGQRHIGGVALDVTDRVRAETALSTSEARFRNIVENGYDMICEVAPDGSYTYVSPNHKEILGYDPDELLGFSAFNHVHPLDFTRVRTEVGRAIAAGATCQIVFRFRRKDGEWRWLETHGRTFRTGTGERRGVGITRDVTDRIVAENERRRREASEREQTGLRSAVAAMDQVLGVVGHELRTPLAGMRAMTELLLTAEIDDTRQRQQFIDAIHTESLRMTEMVNNLLEASRLNSGTAKWNWSRFRLDKICREAMELMRPLAPPDLVQMSFRLDPETLEMSGDEAAIRRLLVNLLNNARKNTTRGFIRVFGREERVDGAAAVILSIQDSGAGISVELAHKLGRPFATNSGVIGADSARGAGLGLAICKGIAATHGGGIQIESVVGVGTTVSARLQKDLGGPNEATNQANCMFSNI